MSATNGNGADDPTLSIIAQLRDLRSEQIDALAEHDAKRQAYASALKATEKALQALGDEIPQQQSKPGRKRKTGNGGISAERVSFIRETVLSYAASHEEFRQVDIRACLPDDMSKSSIVAMAFEQLRQEGTVRLARQDGNNKFFRLTPQALASAANE